MLIIDCKKSYSHIITVYLFAYVMIVRYYSNCTYCDNSHRASQKTVCVCVCYLLLLTMFYLIDSVSFRIFLIMCIFIYKSITARLLSLLFYRIFRNRKRSVSFIFSQLTLRVRTRFSTRKNIRCKID